MPLGGLSFVKKLAAFGIIYATDSLLQNMTTIVCFGNSPSIFLTVNPVDMLNHACQFFKIRVVFHMLYL